MKNRIFSKRKLMLLGLGFILWNPSIAQNGEEIFKTNCAVCHKTTADKFVGPGMAGITDKRSTDWLKSWIRDSQGLIASGDADAKAIFDEYSGAAMPPFPALSDAEMDALIGYMATLEGGAADGEVAVVENIEYSAVEIADGKKYFTGEKRFFNGGPSCITCHNVTDEGVVGGYLAKDLTDVYVRMGEAGISAMVGNAPFPAMKNAYLNNPVTQQEMKSLSAYLKSVSANAVEDKTSSVMLFVFLGIGGFVVFLIVIMGVWSRRKKEHVKERIFERQLKSVN